MKWDDKLLYDLNWSSEIINYDQKLTVGKQLAEKANNGDVIGFGSGSTSFLAVLEISKRIKNEGINICAVPTSKEIELTCYALGIQTLSINCAYPDWSFDGADEVDSSGNLIKGRGGAMFNEKLIMRCSMKNFILVDETKLVSKLGANFPVPIEVSPNALMYVKKCVFDIGATKLTLRPAKGKDGPIITENGNFILDANFDSISAELESQIKSITGVIESGLFWGYPVDVIKS